MSITIDPDAGFIAVDWGSSNRRAFRIEGGEVAAVERDGPGVLAMRDHDYAAEVAGLRARLGDLPVLLAGMVGANIGWRTASYVAAPADSGTIARGLYAIDARTAIVPGVSILRADRADVMRGEEVQLLGAAAAGLIPTDALVVQPGTHCKWVRLVAGRIVGFTTAMTGELFALLRAHSILAPLLGGPVAPGPAFTAGLGAARRGDLAAELFGVRAGHLLGNRADGDAAAYVSGLLIGADVAARLAEIDDEVIYVLSDATLGPLYETAIAAHGCTVRSIDSETAFVAGMIQIARAAP